MNGGSLEEHFATLEKQGWDLLVVKLYRKIDANCFVALTCAMPVRSTRCPSPCPPRSAALTACKKLYEAFQSVYESVYGCRLRRPRDIVTLRVKAIGKIPLPR